MLQPKRTKFRKVHRGHRRGMAHSGNTVAFGEFGIQALEPAWITARQIEAARRAITHHMRRGGKVWIRIFPDKVVIPKPPGRDADIVIPVRSKYSPTFGRDVGMIMAGTMAAKYVWTVRAGSHLTTASVVWAGAVSAMVTKGGLAVTLGAGVRAWIADRVNPTYVRYAAVIVLIILGVLSVLETLGVLVD